MAVGTGDYRCRYNHPQAGRSGWTRPGKLGMICRQRRKTKRKVASRRPTCNMGITGKITLARRVIPRLRSGVARLSRRGAMGV